MAPRTTSARGIRTQTFTGLQKTLFLVFLLGALSAGYYYTQTRASTTLGVTLTTNPDLENGLALHYTFDGEDVDWGDSVAEIKDRSGNGNDGNWINHATTTAPGVIGQSLDNYQDYINAGSDASLDDLEQQGGNGMTIATWIKPRTRGSNGQAVIATKDSNYGVGWDFRFFYNDSFQFMQEGTTDLVVQTSDNILTLGEWQHVVVTWSGTTSATSVHVYINAVETGYDTQQDGEGLFADASRSLHIGGRAGGFRSDTLYDDFRIYNRALSPAEVKRLYQLGATTKVAETITTNPTLETGLVGHWTFDGMDMDWASSTAEVRDRSGNGLHGDAVNGVSTHSTTNGVLGQALDFKDGNDVVDLGTPALLDMGTSDLTLTAWLNSRDPTLLGGDTQDIYRDLTGNRRGPGFDLRVANSRVLAQICDGISGTTTLQTDAILEADTWYHIAFVVDKSYATGARLYVDGVLLETADPTGVGSISNAIDVGLGGNSPSGSENFYGALDDVRLYNRALSPQEIKRLYELGATTKVAETITTNPTLETGLVGHWTFDGADVDWSSTTAEILDRSGNDYHGNATTTMNAQSVKAGQLGQGMSFNGTSDMVVIPVSSGSALNITGGEMTLAAWVYADTWDTLADPRILSRGDTSGTPYSLHVDNGTGARQIVARFHAGGITGTANTGVLVTTGTWHHVVARYDSASTTGEISVFLNGVLEYTGDHAGGGNLQSSVPDFNIGNATGATRPLDGTIDDARVYNRALTGDEIRRLYELGAR